MSKVYIILVNWNGFKDTIECIESIYKNDYINYNIVVVDNDSQNESVEKIHKWALKNNKKIKLYTKKESESLNISELDETKKIFVIKNEKNNGFANANNLGIKLAMKDYECKYVWILNNDTVIDSKALINMVNLAENKKNVGIIGSKLLYFYDKNIIQEIYGEVLWNDNGKGIGNKELDLGQWDKNIEIKQGRIMGASMLVDINAIKKVGLISEKYFMEYEETDWCMRFLNEGYKIFYCYSSKVWHKEGGTIKDLEVNKRKFLWKEFDIEPPLKFLIHNYYSFRNNIYFTKIFFKNDIKKYNVCILPKKLLYYLIKAYINKENRKEYIKLIFRAVSDGYSQKMGKTIDPLEWKEKFKE
ncbi:TPA: glycosyltransferase family 2 protein [Clostridium perfringens]|uniref:glycosyltransferase family 2 protein n=1 Tax=Clostridium perfringens TaxID=1502 RepID=UPI001A2369E3|nr:glycosyltransferase family 2 protein [Clostridium perfringens]MDZ5005639.1 glycosyltransferase [Clostridium perfringens]HAT4185663.1 glycosyltransferase family 2 protein [Clostridium perfringens]HAT4194386.1 glycosyltransferase family 2 protein [Clostridium perfringens]HAT4196861.1 glycosyltransferase family 2 protein [Clostridium perfringens]HAT4207255.1 glycosyltransferase family 2 protein [Clostridium perfringens]